MAALSASEVLTVVAEIAIALAGFAGVVVAFRQRGLDALPAHEQLRLRYMLLVACISVLFALLPFVPHYLRLNSTATWTISSGLLALGLVSLVLAVHVQAATPAGHRLSRTWIYIYQTGLGLAAIALLLNAFGAFGEVLPGVYLVGLGCLLFYATSLFVRLVLSNSPSTGTNSPAS